MCMQICSRAKGREGPPVVGEEGAAGHVLQQDAGADRGAQPRGLERGQLADAGEDALLPDHPRPSHPLRDLSLPDEALQAFTRPMRCLQRQWPTIVKD